MISSSSESGRNPVSRSALTHRGDAVARWNGWGETFHRDRQALVPGLSAGRLPAAPTRRSDHQPRLLGDAQEVAPAASAPAPDGASAAALRRRRCGRVSSRTAAGSTASTRARERCAKSRLGERPLHAAVLPRREEGVAITSAALGAYIAMSACFSSSTRSPSPGYAAMPIEPERAIAHGRR